MKNRPDFTIIEHFLNKTVSQTDHALVTLNRKYEEKIVTGYDLRLQIAAVAHNLRKQYRIHRGDRIVLVGHNSALWFTVALAILSLGATIVPLYAGAKREDLLILMEHAEPALTLATDFLIKKHKFSSLPKSHAPLCLEDLFNDSMACGKGCDLQDVYRHRSHHPRGSDLAIIVYTSGTTGNPKGVMISHDNIVGRVTALLGYVQLSRYDKIWSYLPLAHIAAQVSDLFYAKLYRGCTVYFVDFLCDRKVVRQEFQSILQHICPDAFLGVPEIWEVIRRQIERKLGFANKMKFLFAKRVKQALGFTNTRYFINTAAKLREETIDFFRAFHIPIDVVYGLSETTGPALFNGAPMRGVVPWLSERNELCISGDLLFSGYFKNRKATQKVLADKVFYTGDIFQRIYTEKEGRSIFSFIRRSGDKDNFKTLKGEFVQAREVSSVIKKHIAKVKEAIVFGGAQFSFPYAIIIVSEADIKARGEEALSKEMKNKIASFVNPLIQSHERVAGIRVISFDRLSIEDGTLTPTMKVVWKKVVKQYGSDNPNKIKHLFTAIDKNLL